MKYVFDFTKVVNKQNMIHLLINVLQIPTSYARSIFEKGKVTLDSTKYPLLEKYLANFTYADENIIIKPFKEITEPNEEDKPQILLLKEQRKPYIIIDDCILLTKEEYQELCKYKGLYLDIIGHIKTVIKEFEEKRQSN